MTEKKDNIRNNINRKTILFGGLFTTILILAGVSIGYFFFAFDSVGYNEYALNQNGITQQIENKVYEKGLYHIGIFNHFIKFPKAVQTIEFFDSLGNPGATRGPLNSRTRDGLLIHIQLAFQYKLRKGEILDLYGTFAKDYEDRYIGQARTTLRDVASFYNAIEFFNNRTIIGNHMKDLLAEDLDIMFCDVVFFQLREIDLPDEFEEALKQVQIAQQQYQIALYEQQAAIVKAETAIIEAQAQANITLITADANAEAYIINMEAQAEALNITLTAERIAYYAMGQQLNLTSSELLALLWIMAIQEHDDSMLIIGTETPLIIETGLNSTKFL
ncbi:MAG: SPFH domain-containing protein [Candidatus Hodarchaeota archaeon]